MALPELGANFRSPSGGPNAPCPDLARRVRRNGGGGIRTHEGLLPPVFKTGALNRSATPPRPGATPRGRLPVLEPIAVLIVPVSA
jgi:hypothetical protein